MVRRRRRWKSLLSLPGVGRKTANLVLILAVREPEEHLRRHARASHCESPWLGNARRHPTRQSRRSIARRSRNGGRIINLYLVTWGQNVCRPVYPRCPALRHQGSLPADRRDGGQQDDAGQLSAGAGLTCARDTPDDFVPLRRPGDGPPSASFFQPRELAADRGPGAARSGEKLSSVQPGLPQKAFACRSEKPEGGLRRRTGTRRTWSRPRTTTSSARLRPPGRD